MTTDQVPRLPRRLPLHAAIRAVWSWHEGAESGAALYAGRPFCVVLIDVVDMAKFNQDQGQTAGDEALASMSRRLDECADAATTRIAHRSGLGPASTEPDDLDPSPALGGWVGADSFVWVSSGLSPREVQRHVTGSLDQKPPWRAGGVGWASHDVPSAAADNGDPPLAELLAAALSALQEAKNSPPGTWCWRAVEKSL